MYVVHGSYYKGLGYDKGKAIGVTVAEGATLTINPVYQVRLKEH